MKQKAPAAAEERHRAERWNAPGRSKVTHQKYGTIVVPHRSNLSAIINAAEVWGCDWVEILDAEVWAANKDTPTARPHPIQYK